MFGYQWHLITFFLLSLQIPDHFHGDGEDTPYELIVEGNVYGGQHGSLFLHRQPLTLERPDVRIILQSEHPTYRQGQTGNFPPSYPNSG